jgi:hypothetical protein
MHWVPPKRIANIVIPVILPEEFRAESDYAPPTVHAKRCTSQKVENKEPNPETRVPTLQKKEEVAHAGERSNKRKV